MKRIIILISILIVALLAACSSAPSDEVAATSDDQPAGQENPGTSNQAGSTTRLQENYSGALSVEGQLAAGTLMLEETALAVDEAAATNLLPLWQAVQSLANSDTTAAAEINAVLNQIQDTMDPEQVAAIAEMALTQDSLTEMLEDGTLAFGRGGLRGGEDGEREGFTGGGFPGGGVPGGGQSRPGGGPGGLGGFQNADPNAIATRQAEFSGGDLGSLQERAMLGAVVRLLGTKTGEITDDGGPGRLVDTVFTVISKQTGLSVEDIQGEFGEGATLAEIIEANGGNLEVVREALIEAFNALPNAEDLDPETMADQWLGFEEN